MQEAKNTARALVRIGYDGSVHKIFRAKDAETRFENELKVLEYLEHRGCDFVPRVISYDRANLELVTTNCGARVQQISDQRLKDLFAELESYGVRHDDPFLRNVTYRAADGRFCIIDFEFATILDPAASESASPLIDAASPATVNFSPAPQLLRWSAVTDRGRFRPNNEDAFLGISFNKLDLYFLGRDGEAHSQGMDFIFAVSDGMGGERSGEFASKFTLDNVTRLLPRRFQLLPAHRRVGIRECLLDLFQGIHRQLTSLGESYSEGHNMGSTLSLIWYVGGWLHFGHIGDSRIYLLPRDGGIRQITEDHTHVGWLRRQGKLNEREARTHPRKNVLAQSLGAGNQTIAPQIGELACEPGDRLLLCTDGVIEGLWDRGLEELVRDPPAQYASLSPARRIVQAAVEESGRDNATAYVVEIQAAP
ncbi:MAG: protein phosphatase 2C domain-containing protein [Pirellulales bacterium]